MKKLLKLLIVFVITVVVAFSSFSCKGGSNTKEDVGENGSIAVKVFNGGYKLAWIKKMAQKFKEETGIAVNFKDYTDTSAWESEIASKVSTTDLFFSSSSGHDLALKGNLVVGGVRYDSYLADLTDLFNSTVPGEDVLYKDKMIPTVLNSLNHDVIYDYENKGYKSNSETGKFYTTCWANGSLSFVVNMDKWKSEYGEFPKTTDELFDLCDKVIDDQKSVNVNTRMYPFAYSLKSSYWKFIYETWVAQYMGENEFAAYNSGYDAEGNQYTKELLRYPAFLESLKCIDECIMARGTNNAECYSHPNSTSDDFTTTQFKLLSGRALMQPNGNWLISEMNSSFKGQNLNVQFKRVPVISSIIDRCPTIENDNELSALIDAIDADSVALKGNGYDVSQEDFDRVNYARRVVITLGSSHGAFIPAYSKNIDKAKKFLLYMAKDEYLEIYYKETLGSTLPFNYDYSSVDYQLGTFIDSERKMLNGAISQPILMSSNNKLAFFNQTLFNGMCMPYQINGEAETLLSAVNSADRKSANQIFDANYNYAVKNWSTAYEPYCW